MAEPGTTRLTIERFCSSPSLSGAPPKGLKLSADGAFVGYLKGREADRNCNDLWLMGVESGEHQLLVDADRLQIGELSDEEKARRERMRAGDSAGITQYFWAADGASVLIPSSDSLYMCRLEGKQLERLDMPEQPAITDAKLSPNGNFVSFISSQNLLVFELGSGQLHRISTDGGGPVSNGVAEFVAQEEMSRYTGYWWADTEKAICFERYDESEVRSPAGPLQRVGRRWS